MTVESNESDNQLFGGEMQKIRPSDLRDRVVDPDRGTGLWIRTGGLRCGSGQRDRVVDPDRRTGLWIRTGGLGCGSRQGDRVVDPESK